MSPKNYQNHSLKAIFSDQRGSTLVFYTFMLLIATAMSSLVIDVGDVYLEKARLSASCDAAALAGAQELVVTDGNIETVVDNYVTINTIDTNRSKLLINHDEKTLELELSKSVDSYFARLFNIDQNGINAIAKVKLDNISALSGVKPLAVVQQNFIFGAQYTLKEGGGDGTSGNYCAIQLGNSGASVYRNNLLGGYSGTIHVGDQIPTETGNIAGSTVTCINQLIRSCTHTPPCTYQDFNSNCSRIFLIPVVNTLTVNGKKAIKVLGFATFFIEGVTDHVGQSDVVGRFITHALQGEMSGTGGDFGTYGIRLIK